MYASWKILTNKRKEKEYVQYERYCTVSIKTKKLIKVVSSNTNKELWQERGKLNHFCRD